MDGRIFRLRQRLTEDFERQWTVEEMARVINLSASHCHKLFRAHTGMSPIAFLHELRLEKARELLENTFLAIKQISSRTGLQDGSHFTRDFKKKYGSAPSEYRRQFLDRTPGEGTSTARKIGLAKRK